MSNNHSTPSNISDNLNAAANKLFAIESLSRQIAEKRLAAGAEGEDSVSECDMTALQEGISALARGALEEIERVIQDRQAAPALHVVA